MAKTLPPLGPDECPRRLDGHLCARSGAHCDDHECNCGHRWASLPEVRVLRLQPDDVLVTVVNRHLSRECTATVAAQLKEEFPGHRVLITEHIELLVVRPEVADRIEEGTPS